MQTTLLRSDKLPTWDEQLVAVLQRVASVHSPQDWEIAVAFSDELGEIYRTATVDGPRQLARLGQDLKALGLVPRGAPNDASQSGVVLVYGLHHVQPGKS